MKQKVIYLVIVLIIPFLKIQAQSIEETQRLISNDIYIEDYFGSALDISGEYAVIGACYDDDNGTNSGSAYIFHNSSGSWTQEAKIKASDGESNDFFALTVAMSGDYAFIGAVADYGYTGSVYVFYNNSGTWEQTAKLMASDAVEGDVFGYSISVSDDYAIIGAYGDDDNGESSGSAYIFHNDSGTWTETVKITASDGAEQDRFAESVDIHGEYAIVGASGDDDNGIYSGSAYIFQNISGTWTQITKLTASDAMAYDIFGNSVGIFNDFAVIGAPQDNGAEGSAYIFYNNSGTWEEQTNVTPKNTENSKYFGKSVRIFDDFIAIGSPGEVSFEPYLAGFTYLYHNDFGTWTHVAKFVSSDLGIKDQFGYCSGITDGYVLIGGPRNDTDGEDAGAAYTYDIYLPVITTQPDSQVAEVGYSVSFTVVAEGTDLTYQWQKNGIDLTNSGNIGGATSPELTITSVSFDDEGIYNCIVTGDYGAVKSDDAELLIVVGVVDHLKYETSVYPNPTNGKFSIEFADHRIQPISITDITGKIILKETVIHQNEIIDLSGLERGIYIINFLSDNFTKKIVIE